MTETTQQQTTQTPAAEPPLPPELEYLKAHGEDITEYLPKPSADSTPQTTASDPATQTQPQDDAEPGEVTVGEDGRLRDARGKFVPKDAYVRQRQRATSAETELTKLRDQLARLEERAKVAQEGATATAGKAKDGEAAEPIDPEKDFIGALRQTIGKITSFEAELKKGREETATQLTERDMVQAYRDDTVRVRAQRSDYADAYKHVVVARAREMIAFGITDKDTIAKQISEDEQEIVRQSLANKRSPAETIYALAVAKGYQLKTAGTTTANGQVQQTPQAATSTPAQQIVEAINQGQASGKTLTGVGGSANPGLTLDQFLAMPPEQIIALKASPQGMAQLRAIGAA